MLIICLLHIVISICCNCKDTSFFTFSLSGGAAAGLPLEVVLADGAVVAQTEAKRVAAVVEVRGAVVGGEEEGGGTAFGQADEAQLVVVAALEDIVPRAAQGQVVPLGSRQAALDVEVGEAVDHRRAAHGAVEGGLADAVGGLGVHQHGEEHDGEKQGLFHNIIFL